MFRGQAWRVLGVRDLRDARLRLSAEGVQQALGTGLRGLGLTSSCLHEGFELVDRELHYRVHPGVVGYVSH